MTTPPIQVQYAFASVLSPAANPVRALAAATATPLPAAPELPCGLCLLDPAHSATLSVAGSGDVAVHGAAITVNSTHPEATVLSDSGGVTADRIDIAGGVSLTGTGSFVPPATTGVPPTPDPLAALPTPDALPSPPPCCFGRVTVTTNRTLTPGVYDSITVTDHATLTLTPGVYVLTDFPGLAVLDHATVRGTGVTLYLTCSTYPTPCPPSAPASPSPPPPPTPPPHPPPAPTPTSPSSPTAPTPHPWSWPPPPTPPPARSTQETPACSSHPTAT